MILGQHRSAVGTFLNRIDAQNALNELLGAGFLMAQICVVCTEADRDQVPGGAEMSDYVGYIQEEAATGATIAGSMLGAVGGCLVGIGMLAVPGVGSVVAVGTSATALAMTIAGAGIGLCCGGLIEALAGLGILADRRATFDGDRFSQGEYLVMVDGKDDDVRRAESILSKSYSRKVWIW